MPRGVPATVDRRRLDHRQRTGGAGSVVRRRPRVLHRHLRRGRGQRRVAVDPDRSRRRHRRVAVGGRRLHVDVRRVAARGRGVQRSPRGAPSVHRRRRRLRRRIGGLWPRPRSRPARRRPLRPGLGGGGDDAGVDGPDQPGLPRGPVESAGRGDLGDGRRDRLVVGTRTRRRAHRRLLAPDLPHQHPRRRRRNRARHSDQAVADSTGPLRHRQLRHRSRGNGRAHVRRHRGRRTRLHRTRRAHRVRPRRARVRRVRRPPAAHRTADGPPRPVPTAQRHRHDRGRLRVRRRLLRAAVRDEPLPATDPGPVGVPDRARVPADDAHRSRPHPIQRPHRRTLRQHSSRRHRTRPDERWTHRLGRHARRPLRRSPSPY